MGSSRPLNLEYLIAPGDSGGGVFIRSGGKELLAGINSFVEADIGPLDSGHGSISGHTRVSVFNRWIDNVLQGPRYAGRVAILDAISVVHIATCDAVGHR
jgi:hypothetical protein